jgi:TonB-dependent SusC/RagA subfamily outer membrane receptor
MKFSKFILYALLFFIGIVNSQQKLSGHVVNSNKKPIANARIYLDSIYSGKETDRKGNFELALPQTVTTINIYSKKYGLLSSEFNNENVMNFMFLNSRLAAGERIQKGGDLKMVYSKQSNKYEVDNITGSGIETVEVSGVFNTIYDLIRGRLPGVSVSRDNRISIRGVSSIRNISDPLFVVDRVIVSSIDFISPNNVKKVSVLKGAEASIYGSQGSSGVIVITTK